MSQCVCYDEGKAMLVAWLDLDPDAATTHTAASLVAGLVSTTVTNPFDVVKAKMFTSVSKSPITPLECAAQLFKDEGVRGLLRGWSASYTRLGPLTTLVFVLNEKFRVALGLAGL